MKFTAIDRPRNYSWGILDGSFSEHRDQTTVKLNGPRRQEPNPEQCLQECWVHVQYMKERMKTPWMKSGEERAVRACCEGPCCGRRAQLCQRLWEGSSAVVSLQVPSAVLSCPWSKLPLQETLNHC